MLAGLALGVAVLLTGGGCAGGGTPRPTAGSTGVRALDAAIGTLGAARGRLLAKVDVIQRAATALDDTDATCALGQGVAARTAHRVAVPLLQQANTAVGELGGDVASYTEALRVLGTLPGGASRSPALSAAQSAALATVVRTGLTEAAAMSAFRAAASGAWPAYRQLSELEDTWITRAVTPWYRTDQEGASAYAVLVGPSRPVLDRARTTLGTAAEGVQAPSAATAVALKAADRALASLRTG